MKKKNKNKNQKKKKGEFDFSRMSQHRLRGDKIVYRTSSSEDETDTEYIPPEGKSSCDSLDSSDELTDDFSGTNSAPSTGQRRNFTENRASKSAAWYSGEHHPMVTVSDNLDHTKHTVVAYMDRLLEEIPTEVNEVSVWSDGPSSQFKNRYIAASLKVLQEKHKLQVSSLIMAKRMYGVRKPQDITNAIAELKKNNIGLNECCRKYNIPKKTFTRHLMGQVKRGLKRQCGQNNVNGRDTALPIKVEDQLVSHILRFEELLFGLTITDVRKLAYDIIAANPHLSNRFNKQTKLDGKKWYYNFMSWHPNLSLHQTENISMTR
ncbi:hypothetical protein ANN_24526 [Periplaneta americana]|uniref:HTH psq-type domain-containing protein n=1 Tax=Periplaneta americana TaxID=6978 RepID=A0ABQ8S3A1_PERAM|nr:hypothetical protein ANN_24526 [Periplaneta americana]